MNISIFDQASQAAKKDSPQVECGGNDAGNNFKNVAAAGSADRQADTPKAVKVSASPRSEQKNIPQGVQPYDDRAPILACGYAHDIHEFYFKREVIKLFDSSKTSDCTRLLGTSGRHVTDLCLLHVLI